jgi:predicted dehydrogenase
MAGGRPEAAPAEAPLKGAVKGMVAGAAPLRMGILGAAGIGRLALIEPSRGRDDVTLAAVAARDLGRAQAYAAKFGFAQAYQGYQALLDDPQIDAVYNALPPSLHARWTIAALNAGKAVLCEKPFAMDAGEARAMVDAAQSAGLVLMEGFHYRYHPLTARLIDIVASDELGDLRRLEAVVEVPTPDGPNEIRHDPALGGGVLMDLGSYAVHLCRTLVGAEPAVAAAAWRLAASGVDAWTTADLTFPSGVEARITASFETGPQATLTIEGERGSLKARNPLLPQYGNRVTIEVGGERRDESFTREPTYAFQLAAFADAVRGGPAPPTSGEDSVAQMRVIDAIRAKATA